MSKGKLIVIEGLDGSGKATQAKLLAQHLAGQGLPVREVTFPDYASDSSVLIKMYLAGQFGSKPDDVNAYAASSFFAVDRYASYKTDWGRFYEEGGVVIADRYTTSNAVHQCSKLPPEQQGCLPTTRSTATESPAPRLLSASPRAAAWPPLQIGSRRPG